MDIRQYIAWGEKRIARLVIAEKLRAGLLGVTQGPLTLTYKVRLLDPSPTALRKLLSMGPALSQALQAPGVRVTEQLGYIAVEVPSPIKRTPTGAELASMSQGLSVALGVNSQRQPVRVDLQQHGALFWIGPSRRGKTQSMKSTIYSLASSVDQLYFAILSQKRQDWQSFERATQCLGLVSKPAEALTVLQWASALLQKRSESVSKHSPVLIVCDDLLNLLSAEQGLADPLAEISSMGAGLGVHLLAGTQEAGSKRGSGGAGVENNATARILYRNSSAAAAARATGQGAEGLQQLSGAKGDALLLLDGSPIRVATGLADDRDILQLRQRSKPKAPPWHRSAPVTVPTSRDANGSAKPVDVGGSGAGGFQSAEVVLGGSTPVLTGEPGTSADRELVREIYRQTGSKNKTCKHVWGHKNSRTYAWLNECLAEAESVSEKRESADTPIQIDMNSSEGLQAIKALQSAGLLARDTITEVIKPQ